ncbi:hypothetical protein [Rubrivirga sp.]|uniref:hypothetical protein n=1 Tax=Rubrivirga sp. TaxID=1885344 RepID=UPI003B52EA34
MRLPALLLALATLAGCSTGAQTISYDEFSALPRAEQVRVFNEIEPENRAALVRTQAERWLDIYRDRLNPEEVAAAEDVIAQIVPDLYDGAPQSDRAEALKEQALSTLPLEFVRLAFAEPGATPPPASRQD